MLRRGGPVVLTLGNRRKSDKECDFHEIAVAEVPAERRHCIAIDHGRARNRQYPMGRPWRNRRENTRQRDRGRCRECLDAVLRRAGEISIAPRGAGDRPPECMLVRVYRPLCRLSGGVRQRPWRTPATVLRGIFSL